MATTRTPPEGERFRIYGVREEVKGNSPRPEARTV